jgi:hypothetical protein
MTQPYKKPNRQKPIELEAKVCFESMYEQTTEKGPNAQTTVSLSTASIVRGGESKEPASSSPRTNAFFFLTV